MKLCRGCNTEKPLEDFTIVARNKNGRHSKCRICYSTYMREWSRQNRKVVNARVLKRHHANAEKLNWERKLRYEANKEQHLKATNEWQKNNKEKVTAYKAANAYKRRAQKKQGGVFKVSTEEIIKLRRQKCFYCKENDGFTIDHVIPLDKGGRHAIGNLVACCKSCNSSKHNKFVMEWRMRKIKLANVH